MVSPAPKKFGTIKGVFIPSVLTIFGVIMFLRMGWMVANVGIIGSVAIITIASAITFMTGLSIAATATNMKVGAGGAYYMISRSFGIETGAAIGIPLFFAQSLGIAFYISGFTESLLPMLPALSGVFISFVTLTVLFAISYFSADLALKVQGFIFVLIVISLISFFNGGPHTLDPVSIYEPVSRVSFWVVFAVVFPAVTGIEAGLAMSGDLKNPAKALPYGTLSAVLVGYVVYLAIPIYLYMHVPQEILATQLFIMKDIAWIGALIVLGLWGSTLSSAMGALLGGPRTLQALASDRVLFPFFAKGSGSQMLPRRATVVSYVIAAIALALGDLNSIAMVLTMFFLTSYGLVNLAAFFESLMKNPSWRPTFRFHWSLSLIGFVLCCIAMLLINAASALIAFVLVTSIYIWTKKRNLSKHWSDIRRSMLITFARNIVFRLQGFEKDARTWRPNTVVYCGSPTNRFPLIHFGHLISGSRSFLTVCSILSKEHQNVDRKKKLETSIYDFLRRKKVQALVEVHFAPNHYEGAVSFSEHYGLGELKPNLFVFGESKDENNVIGFARTLQSLYEARKNVIILRNHSVGQEIILPNQSGEIHVWWGRQAHNASLMLALAFLISLDPSRKKSTIKLNSTLFEGEDKAQAQHALQHLISQSRLPIEYNLVELKSGEDLFEQIGHHSRHADIMFMGIRSSREDESSESYSQYYQSLLEHTRNFPPTAMVMAAEEMDFKEIFSS